jgi:ABC-type multidrug transport system fused ATPase/permease subunit
LIDSFWDVILWMLAVYVFAMFFWLFIVVLSDMWSNPDSGGGAKAFWTIFIIIVPWLGLLIYLIANGSGMGERALKKREAQENYIRQVAGSGGSASELATLSDLKAKGDITQAEFDKAKASLLA